MLHSLMNKDSQMTISMENSDFTFGVKQPLTCSGCNQKFKQLSAETGC